MYQFNSSTTSVKNVTELLEKGKSLNSILRKDISTKSIRLVNPNTLEIDGVSCEMTNDAFMSFCKALGITKQSNLVLQNTFESEFSNLINTINNSLKTDKIITLIINTDSFKILDVLNGGSPMSYNSFTNLVNDFFDKNPTFQVKSYDITNELFRLNIINPNLDINPFDSGNDIFNGGLSLEYYHNRVQICNFYERLVCSNGMRVIDKENQIVLKNSTSNDYGIVLDKMRKFKLSTDSISKFNSTIRRLKNTEASYDELSLIHSNLGANINFEANPRLLDDATNLKYIIEKYENSGITYEKLLLNSKKAHTNVNLYDAINNFTDIVSHPNEAKVKFENEKSKLKLDMFLNNMINKKEFDFEMKELPNVFA